jgi:hypothetical protein
MSERNRTTARTRRTGQKTRKSAQGAKNTLLAKALKVVRAQRPRELPPGPHGQSEAVLETSRWFHGSRHVLGSGIGVKYSGKKRRTRRLCIQVFVDEKPAASKLHPEQIVKPFLLEGKKIDTDVIRIKSAQLHLGIGQGIGAGTRNVGSVGAFLIDAQRNLYVLSAAHVLGESFRPDANPRVVRSVVKRGGTIFDYGQSGTLQPPPVAVAQLFDRTPLDFAGSFPMQNLDVAVARINAGLATEVKPGDIPYGPPAWPTIDDDVRVIGVGTRGEGASGQVSTLDFTPTRALFNYADPAGRMKPALLWDLCLAAYESTGGDSGGMVLRTSDNSAVGIHIGAVDTQDAGLLGVFIALPRVLGRWRQLRMLHQT